MFLPNSFFQNNSQSFSNKEVSEKFLVFPDLFNRLMRIEVHPRKAVRRAKESDPERYWVKEGA
jgi:hypothetical protein